MDNPIHTAEAVKLAKALQELGWEMLGPEDRAWDYYFPGTPGMDSF